LSLNNKNDLIKSDEIETSSSSKNTASSPSEQSSKKFRIQSDWSDTGPNSVPIDESPENNGD
jgi:hypothetical protein